MSGQRLANLLIVGVPKAGTTSLFNYLAQHRDICGSDPKSTWYFSPVRYREGDVGPPEEYARHFRHCTGQRYAMEATPGLLYGGRPMTAAIQRLLGSPRVLVSLRNPTDRLWSYYNMVRNEQRIPADLDIDGYIDKSLSLRSQGVDWKKDNSAYFGLSASMYAEHLDDWLDAFGTDLGFVFFEHLARDPVSTVAQVCDWLGIDSDVTGTFRYAVENRTVQQRHARVQRVAKAVNARGRAVFRRSPGLRNALRTAYRGMTSAPPSDGLDPATRRRLDGIFRAGNEALSRRLGERGETRLPGWLTEVGASGHPER